MLRKKGSGGTDTLSGGNAGDALYGYAGNDLLKGLLGGDLLFGDDGDDTLDGGTGADTLLGGHGNDTYIVDDPGDLVWEPFIGNGIVRISTTAGGGEADGPSSDVQLSSDGWLAVFTSEAENLSSEDADGSGTDVYLKDLVTGEVRVLNTGYWEGVPALGEAYAPAFSADGRFVVFETAGSNLVAVDGNSMLDVFVTDLATGTVERVSTGTAGTEGNGTSGNPDISADGRYVVFESWASNLVAGDWNSTADVFLKDRLTGETRLISSDRDGLQGNGWSAQPQITPDARFVLFLSYADDLVGGDTNGDLDVFVKDLLTGAVARVNTSSEEGQANSRADYAQMTPDARYVVFSSAADNLVPGDSWMTEDVFVKDRATGQIVRANTDAFGAVADNDSVMPGISDDGRYVVFASKASNLVWGDSNGVWDVFVKDMLTGAIARVSTDGAGVEGNGNSSGAAITPDGRYITFVSVAGNLPGSLADTNGVSDVFRVLNPLMFSSGTDTVKTSIDYTLPENLNDLVLTGSAPIDGTGNGMNNKLSGNAAPNLLLGLGGDDTLIGAAGADTLKGGTGNDTYNIDDAGDTITEFAGQGIDSVIATLTHTLGANVEHLTLGGSTALDGSGNGLGNTLAGNAAANRLAGLGGGDSLAGNDGDDTLAGGSGNDTLAGGAGHDVFRFDAALNARTNVDTIVRFTPLDDTIELENAVFGALGTTGALAAKHFLKLAGTAETATVSASAKVLYDKSTGDLYYDANGGDPLYRTLIATLNGDPDGVSYADFIVT